MSTDQVLDVMRNMHKKWHGTYGGRLTVRVSPVGCQPAPKN
jgi:hypothetical protein